MNNKTAQIEDTILELTRQYPAWPSTFSACACERGIGRGGGKCATCIEEHLASLVGRSLAWEIHQSIKEFHRLKCEALFQGEVK